MSAPEWRRRTGALGRGSAWCALLVLAIAVVVHAAQAVQAQGQSQADGMAPEKGASTTAVPATTAVNASVERGEYVARASDCISCHTAAGGAPFAGGLAMETPFGTIVSTNITPHPTSGIGNYTAEDFKRVLREGRAKDGHYLYPAMPYVQFTKLSDADVQDLYAYFMQGVAPKEQDNARTQLAWPFSQRALMRL